jgi:phosphate transport system protein
VGKATVIEGHISKAYDGALAQLHAEVLKMGALVLDQVRQATHAYSQWDEVAAQRVLEREKTVNSYDDSIDEDQLALIAMRQPVASDLRAVVAMSRAVDELERAGDEAKKVARTVLRGAGRPDGATAHDVQYLGALATRLMQLALGAFAQLDWDAASEAIAGDKNLDAEYASGLRRLLTRVTEDPRHFEIALQAAFVLKSLERIGDHARNVARHMQAIGRDNLARQRGGDGPVSDA